MNRNEGTGGWAPRVVAGSRLIGPAAAGKRGVWAGIGSVSRATGLIGWCPSRTLLGMNPCSVRVPK